MMKDTNRKKKTMSKKKKANEYKDVDRESNNVYISHWLSLTNSINSGF